MKTTWNWASLQHLSLSFLLITRDEGDDVKLPLTPLIVHVANFTKDWSLCPSLIVKTAYGPKTSNISVWISSIVAVFVIEVNGMRQSNVWGRSPFENLLCTIHSDLCFNYYVSLEWHKTCRWFTWTMQRRLSNVTSFIVAAVNFNSWSKRKFIWLYRLITYVYWYITGSWSQN